MNPITPSRRAALTGALGTEVETRTNASLALTNNPNLGSFMWNGQKVGLNRTKATAAPSVTAAKTLFDQINAANPGSSYRTDPFEKKAAFADYFTYHPLGGMIIGEATELDAAVKGVPGLFVLDGSLVPGKIGVNPFVTITALAERCMDKLMAAGRFA